MNAKEKAKWNKKIRDLRKENKRLQKTFDLACAEFRHERIRYQQQLEASTDLPAKMATTIAELKSMLREFSNGYEDFILWKDNKPLQGRIMNPIFRKSVKDYLRNMDKLNL